MSRWALGSVLVLAIGCGAPAPPPPAQVRAPAPPATTTPAGRTDSNVQASIVPHILPTVAPATKVRPVSFERLLALLPTVDGWTRFDDRGEQLSNPIVTTRAEAKYERAGSHVELEIADSTLDPVLLAPLNVFLAPGYSERSESGFRRAARLGGHPAFEEWQQRERRGEIGLIVAGRFIVRATGYDIDALAPVRRLVTAVRMTTLATLK